MIESKSKDLVHLANEFWTMIPKGYRLHLSQYEITKIKINRNTNQNQTTESIINEITFPLRGKKIIGTKLDINGISYIKPILLETNDGKTDKRLPDFLYEVKLKSGKMKIKVYLWSEYMMNEFQLRDFLSEHVDWSLAKGI